MLADADQALQNAGDSGSDDPGGQKTVETVKISDVVLLFMHSWFQGNNHQEIVKLCLASFSAPQLADATRPLL